MDNEDVINFVEYYRLLACKQIKKHKDSEVTASNSCIAQLLCEEARVRWISIVETDDVMIDDISCAVLEFPNYIKKNYSTKQRKSSTSSTVKLLPSAAKLFEMQQNYPLTPTIKKTYLNDARRGSQIQIGLNYDL